jgi:hypothetical protein
MRTYATSGASRSREDVYAVRWEAPDGRAGYMPRADRDWKAYSASKPQSRLLLL